MNKLFIYLFIVLVITPVVLADIKLNGFERERYNLGDEIELSGYVLYNEDTSGLLKINLNCEEDRSTPIYYSLVNIKAGEEFNFQQTAPILKEMLGNCFFDIILESNEETLLQKSSSEISIVRDLRVEAKLNNPVQKPGNIINIQGSIRKTNGIRSERGSITFILNNKLHVDTFSDGDFSFDLTLPEDISSGEHTIEINTEDLNDNVGKSTLFFSVISVPMSITLNLDKNNFLPGEVLPVKALLLDQAGDTISKTVRLEIIDPTGNTDSVRNTISGNIEEVKLDKFVKPGEWKLKVESDKLSSEESFFIEEVSKTEIIRDGTLIHVTNVGNVDYTEPVEVSLEGTNNNYQVLEKNTLKPNQTITIDLSEEAPSGDYELEVLGHPEITGNVVVENNRKSGSSFLGFGALFFVMIFLMYMVVSKGKRKFLSRKDIRKKGRKILKTEKKKEEYIPPKSTKEDVDYLIKKVQTEENKKDEISGNLFKIFDK